MILAGDIGGTKTNFAIISPEKGIRAPVFEQSLSSADFSGPESLIRAFLEQKAVKVTQASLAVAGTVVGSKAAITHLPWVFDAGQLAETFDLERVTLLNDLAATAYLVPSLAPADLHCLNKGEVVSGGSIALLAPGTGLGEAYLTWDGKAYNAYASEGGHADFAPENLRQIELLEYLFRRFDHVSYERVCSGRGIPNIYAFFKDLGYAEEPPWLSIRLDQASDPTPVIVNTAVSHKPPCEICVETLDMFISILGAEAGNLALKVLAAGGVYLAGGILPRIVPALNEDLFMKAFTHKGRFTGLVSKMPVNVILNSKAALLGAAQYVLDR